MARQKPLVEDVNIHKLKRLLQTVEQTQKANAEEIDNLRKLNRLEIDRRDEELDFLRSRLLMQRTASATSFGDGDLRERNQDSIKKRRAPAGNQIKTM